MPKVSHHRELQYWGIHPSLKKELQEELMQEMFKEKDTVNEAFHHLRSFVIVRITVYHCKTFLSFRLDILQMDL